MHLNICSTIICAYEEKNQLHQSDSLDAYAIRFGNVLVTMKYSRRWMSLLLSLASHSCGSDGVWLLGPPLSFVIRPASSSCTCTSATVRAPSLNVRHGVHAAQILRPYTTYGSLKNSRILYKVPSESLDQHDRQALHSTCSPAYKHHPSAQVAPTGSRQPPCSARSPTSSTMS